MTRTISTKPSIDEVDEVGGHPSNLRSPTDLHSGIF